MLNRFVAAVALLCAVLIASPCAEARSRDPFSALVEGIGKAFSPAPVKTRRHVVRVAKASPKVAQNMPENIPEITVHPVPEQPRLATEGRPPLAGVVANYAMMFGIEPQVAVAVVQVESGFDPWTTGGAGEIGLGQLKCQTAREEGYSGTCRNLYGVALNLHFAMKYLAHAKRLSDGSLCGMLSRYNGGLYSRGLRRDYCRRVVAAMN